MINMLEPEVVFLHRRSLTWAPCMPSNDSKSSLFCDASAHGVVQLARQVSMQKHCKSLLPGQDSPLRSSGKGNIMPSMMELCVPGQNGSCQVYEIDSAMRDACTRCGAVST